MYDMPGQIRPLSKDDKHFCEDCTDGRSVPATHRITGEVDSFGAEFYYLCDKHTEEFKTARDNHVEEPRTCPECGKVAVLIEYRDIDEGSCAPLREHCDACHKRYYAQFEDDDYDDDQDYWDSVRSEEIYEEERRIAEEEFEEYLRQQELDSDDSN